MKAMIMRKFMCFDAHRTIHVRLPRRGARRAKRIWLATSIPLGGCELHDVGFSFFLFFVCFHERAVRAPRIYVKWDQVNLTPAKRKKLSFSSIFINSSSIFTSHDCKGSSRRIFSVDITEGASRGPEVFNFPATERAKRRRTKSFSIKNAKNFPFCARFSDKSKTQNESIIL